MANQSNIQHMCAISSYNLHQWLRSNWRNYTVIGINKLNSSHSVVYGHSTVHVLHVCMSSAYFLQCMPPPLHPHLCFPPIAAWICANDKSAIFRIWAAKNLAPPPPTLDLAREWCNNFKNLCWRLVVFRFYPPIWLRNVSLLTSTLKWTVQIRGVSRLFWDRK